MISQGNFEEWKQFLQKRLTQAEQLGMDRSSICDVACQFGDYLCDKVDPKSPEEKLLRDLWQVADPEEQGTMANLMLKLVDEK